jgi:hypothetical protein
MAACGHGFVPAMLGVPDQCWAMSRVTSYGYADARIARGRRWLAIAALLVAGLGWPAAALGDSASIDAVQDAGSRRITVTYTVTSTATGQYGYNGWYAYLAEDHSTRACNTAWANYLRDVGTLHDDIGSETRTVTFQPFFPRQIKLCVYLHNPAGEYAVFEKVMPIPAGYGVQYSTGYNCDDFARRYSAQDFYWLYPGDPSELDDDNDGLACEWNDDPGPGPRIPAEPLPACYDGIDNDGDGATDFLDPDCLTGTGTSEGVPPPPTQCNDGQDNDHDGATDLADKGCASARDTVEGDPPIRKLTFAEARSYVRTALRRKFTDAYRHGYGKQVRACARLSRTRIKCRRVSWNIGDLSYKGWVTIWLRRHANGTVWWHYAYRIKRTNWYCVDTGGRRCTKVFRVR